MTFGIFKNSLSRSLVFFRRALLERDADAGGIPEKAELAMEDPRVWQPAQASQSSSSQPQAVKVEMGQVAGIAKGLNGSVWVFCRGDRVWGASSFTGSRNEQVTHTEPIKQKTVYQLDQDTGATLPKILRLIPQTTALYHGETHAKLTAPRSPVRTYLQELVKKGAFHICTLPPKTAQSPV